MRAELIPLMEVAGVMEVSVEVFPGLTGHQNNCMLTGVFSLQSRAKQLYDAGYKTLTHLANADPAVLSSTLENLYRKRASQIVASAKVSRAFPRLLPPLP